MVELRFNIKDLFTQPIEKIDYNFLPKTFRGDRRQVADATTKFADIVNQLGELSAKTQGLARPVTTSQKLRQSEGQYVYLLADVNAGRNGAIIGMLKVGKKNLYIYNGYESIPVNTPTILDFYVHENYRRNGYGKQIFDRMLHEEGWLPHKCAVDRPSEKLMGFLRKHYGLQRIIPQVNDIVVYEGFFDEEQNHQNSYGGPHITDSPNTALFGPQYTSDESKRQHKLTDGVSSSGLPKIENSQIGRYAAARPVCSMAEIIHNSATKARGEPNSTVECSPADENPEETEAISVQVQNIQIDEPSEQQTNGHTQDQLEPVEEPLIEKVDNTEESAESEHIARPIFLNKQHTGLKNISYNVGMAVSPTAKMDFGPDKIKTGSKLSPVPGQDNTDAESHVSSEGYTDQGYLDLKFYHNRLW